MPAGSSRLTTRCADVVVLGLRGQGQSLRAYDGVGAEVEAVVRALVRALAAGTTVRLQAVRYPSGSNATYDADVASGVRMVRRESAALAGCPRTRVVLVGYSQGAQVAHLAAARTSYAAVVLLGDPLRNPRLQVRTVPAGSLGGRGNAGYGPKFAAPGRVVEVCVPADDVCNAPPTGRVGPPAAAHRTAYQRARVSRAAAQAAVRVGAFS